MTYNDYSYHGKKHSLIQYDPELDIVLLVHSTNLSPETGKTPHSGTSQTTIFQYITTGMNRLSYALS